MNLAQSSKDQEPAFRKGQRVRSNEEFDYRVYEGEVMDVKYVPTRSGGTTAILRVLVDRIDGRPASPDLHECAGFCWEPIVALVN